MSSAQEFAAAQHNSTILNEEISYLTLENKALHDRLAEQQQQHGVKMSEVVSELSSTRKEMVSHVLVSFPFVHRWGETS